MFFTIIIMLVEVEILTIMFFPPHGCSCGSETGTLFLCIIQPEVSNSLLLQSLFKMSSNLQNTRLIQFCPLKVSNHKLRLPKVSAKSKDTNN